MSSASSASASALPVDRRWGDGRERLLHACWELLLERGATAITYRDLAARAGLSHGLIRHYFTDLDELVREALGTRAAEVMADTRLEPATGDIESLAENLAADVARSPNEHALLYEMALRSLRDPKLSPQVRHDYADLIAAVHRTLRRSGWDDDPDLARVVLAALDGLVLQELIDGSPGRLESGIVRLRRLIAAERGEPIG